MRRVQFALYFLPDRVPGRKPYRSSWKMTAEEAAKLNALGQVPGSAEFREVPDTDEEVQRAQTNYQSAGHDGAQPPKA